jgi:hypothetical protein
MKDISIERWPQEYYNYPSMQKLLRVYAFFINIEMDTGNVLKQEMDLKLCWLNYRKIFQMKRLVSMMPDH